MLVTIGGALFLFAYAALAFRRAFDPHVLTAAKSGTGDRGPAIAACLAFTFLNPHVYLDTVILLGSLSARFEGQERLAYGLGATAASFVWFFGLGYGARLLQPVFARPAAWRVLDASIGLVMAAIGFGLLSRLAADG
jgi:L-lysine exporter family protein LysE/ArgO